MVMNRCPRCQGQLFRDEYGDPSCFNCGPLYEATMEAEAALAEVTAARGRGHAADEPTTRGGKWARANRHRRNRGAMAGVHYGTMIGGIRDGCDESPSCLTCPLAECKFVTAEDRYEMRTAVPR